MQTTNVLIRKRIVKLFFIAALVLFLLIFRLGYIQFVKGEELQKKAMENRMRDVPVEAKRGTIYDRNMNELVNSVSADSVYAIPAQIKEAEKTAQALANILDLDYQKTLENINKKVAFVWVKRKIDFEQADLLKKEKLEGIGFVEESRRYYLHETLAPHVLGFTGTDNQGLTGLELSYDKELKGVPGRIVIEYDAAGREIPQAMHKYYEPEPGGNLILTIDQTIQYFVERELDKIVEQYNPKNAVIIVMEPKSGEILAMGNRPTFNPNKWQEYEKSVWDRNPAIWYNYEPGSTFKIITAAGAMEERTVTANDRFYDPGYIEVSDRRIRCWKAGGHGSQSFEEIVQNSCNPGFVELGLDLGKERFYKYINAFGFGRPTNISLPGEAKGIIIPEENVTKINLATISMGQSIAVTPIQLIAAVSAVANGGNLMEPHLVKSITNSKEEVIKEYEPKNMKTVVSEETAKELSQILEKVIVRGSGSKAFIKGYRAGGKTGTAQVVGDGGYVSGKYVASFAGIAPVNDPRIAVLVVVSEPQGGSFYGSQVAAPVFKNVAWDTLRYLQVPQQVDAEQPIDPFQPNKKEAEKVTVPGVVNLPIDEARIAMVTAGLNPEFEGDGSVVQEQVPKEGAVVTEGTTVLLYLKSTAGQQSNAEVTVPNLKGLTMKEAGILLDKMQLGLLPQGSGIAVEQNIEPGTKVKEGTAITVKFEPPENDTPLP